MTGNSNDFLDYLGGLGTKTAPEDAKKMKSSYAAVLKKAGLKRKNSGAKRLGRVLLIAAAVTVCAAITAAATGFRFSDLLPSYFQNQNSATKKTSALTETQLKALRATGTSINQSVVCNGTTINLISAVSDQSTAYIWMKVTAPKGTSLPRNDYDFSDDTIDFHNQNNHTSSGANWTVIPQNDSNPNDNQKNFIIELFTGGIDLQGRELTLKLTDLSTPGKKKLTFVPVIKGTWKFDFKLGVNTPRKEITINRAGHFTAKGQNIFSKYQCTVDKITLSTFSAVLEISARTNAHEQPGMRDLLILHYKDGTQKSFRQLGGTGSSDRAALNFSFDSPIDINNISSITIGDLTVPVS